MKKLKAQLLADTKKTIVMAITLAIGLLLWGRLLLKDPPRTALADPEVVQTSEDDDSSSLLIERGKRVQVDLPEDLARDLFEIDPNRYKQTRSENFDPSQGKSGQSLTDRQIRIDRVRELAMMLTLQSVVVGSRPQAIINGRLVNVGDTVEGFVLVSVAERSVVLKREGVKVRLGM